ncbi:alpha/beta-hydrolase [Athelia psychrophila]|uniref:Alpha/beta-hydrolase n=1 Tax=Athelia psychrophila TaxID=1759441 RepID=A0A166S6L8_9AGAM|nr:alpha/beta-hydrolase [Fibularhizoctonia sp. CBS 109695]
MSPVPVLNRRAEVDGLSLFYRDAGPKDAPVVLLLHGFPSSSHQFRELIPVLGEKYRVIAPDFPGFGFTEIPDTHKYEFTTANILQTLEALLDALEITAFAVYLHDYGAPIGMRLAIKRPEAARALIVQNGNIYAEGWSAYWDPVRVWWGNSDPALRANLHAGLQPAHIKGLWEAGAKDGQIVGPETYTLDNSLLALPGRMDALMDLFFDHRSNVALYPAFRQYIRDSQIPVIVFWGAQDPVFVPAGGDAYKRDAPQAVVKHLDGGHFMLETHLDDIAPDIMVFLGEHL